MHPTPKLESGRALTREQTFFEIELKDLRDLTDAAMRLIRTVDNELGGVFGRVSLCMADRDESDRFPESVFY